MRKLPRPTDEMGELFDAVAVFELCISNNIVENTQTKLLAISDQVGTAAAEYDLAATQAGLHTLRKHQPDAGVTREDMISVYTSRMVPAGKPGRPVYDKIMIAPEHGRCPLCDIGKVRTLDHHLPKSLYPMLAVTPNNLVPSCCDCQIVKKESFPSTAEDQTLHPYFDDFESEVWLRARVIQGVPAAFQYFAQAPAAWGDVTAKRLMKHLDALQLGLLYASNAGSALAEIREELEELFEAGGPDAVRSHLRDSARRLERVSKNLWRAAMHRAATESDWFCNGGFSLGFIRH